MRRFLSIGDVRGSAVGELYPETAIQAG